MADVQNRFFQTAMATGRPPRPDRSGHSWGDFHLRQHGQDRPPGGLCKGRLQLSDPPGAPDQPHCAGSTLAGADTRHLFVDRPVSGRDRVDHNPAFGCILWRHDLQSGPRVSTSTAAVSIPAPVARIVRPWHGMCSGTVFSWHRALYLFYRTFWRKGENVRVQDP